jgi:hypothetical protein
MKMIADGFEESKKELKLVGQDYKNKVEKILELESK